MTLQKVLFLIFSGILFFLVCQGILRGEVSAFGLIPGRKATFDEDPFEFVIVILIYSHLGFLALKHALKKD